jgi:beta-lactamase class D
MKNIFLILFLSTAFGCTTSGPKEVAVAPVVDPYKGKAVCFMLVDVETGQVQKSLNEENCNEQLAACSTFKIPLAVMGFDSGVLKDENTLFKWNGVKYSIEAWNQDQTATDWMKNSTVWYSQVITPKIGYAKIQSYLRKFDYGNQDFTGGLKTAWLTPATFVKEQKGFTLKISGIEQIDFLKKLVRNKLPAKVKAQELTKQLIFLETTPKGYLFSGKTGSGYTDGTLTRRIGWFVGSIKTPDREYVFATNFKDTEDVKDAEYGSRYAKALAIEMLKSEDLW